MTEVRLIEVTPEYDGRVQFGAAFCTVSEPPEARAYAAVTNEPCVRLTIGRGRGQLVTPAELRALADYIELSYLARTETVQPKDEFFANYGGTD